MGNVNIKIDWGYAKDYVEAAYNIMQLKKNNFYIIGSGKKTSILEFVKRCFNFVGLDYKKYLTIDKNSLEKVQPKHWLQIILKLRKILNLKLKQI